MPQLAESYAWSPDGKALTLKVRPGVTFHDGEKLDAAAVKYNIERHKTMPGSNRRGELALVTTVDVVDPMTARLNLSQPFSPLLAQLADRAGMMVSPKAAQAAGDKFGASPVCSGPFKFVERVAQDRIVLEKYPNYWNKGQIFLDKIVYLPIVDSTVRLANLKSGQLDFIERMSPSDVPGLKSDSRFRISKITEIGYQGITHQRRQERPGQDHGDRPRPAGARGVRAGARPRGHRAGGDGGRGGGGQPVGRAHQPVLREERADPEARRREGEAIAAAGRHAQPDRDADGAHHVGRAEDRAGRAGHGQGGGLRREDPVDGFATSLNLADKGDFDAYVLAWSGRADPDGNIYSFDACKQPLNYAGYCKPEVDELLNKSRTASDPAERRKAYEQIAAIVLSDRPIVYLYHRHWLWAYSNKVSGLRTIPDGLVRVQGLKLQ